MDMKSQLNFVYIKVGALRTITAEMISAVYNCMNIQKKKNLASAELSVTCLHDTVVRA